MINNISSLKGKILAITSPAPTLRAPSELDYYHIRSVQLPVHISPAVSESTPPLMPSTRVLSLALCRQH